MMRKRWAYVLFGLFCCSFFTGATWWNREWNYRVSVTVDSGMYERDDYLVRYPLDLARITKEASCMPGQVCTLSFRVVEEKEDGTLTEVPSVYRKAPDTGAAGDTLMWLMTGKTSTMTERKYWIYFDTVVSGKKAALYPAIPGAEEVFGRNVLTNGGFEEVDAKGMPVGWMQINATSQTRGIGEISQKESHSGKNSFHINKPVLEGNSFMLAHGGWRSPARIKPNRKYQVSAWIKSSAKGYQCTQMTFLGEDWKYLPKESGRAYVFARASGVHDWVNVSNVLVSPPGAVYVGLFIHLFQSEGEAWFDDIEIIEIPSEELPAMKQGLVEERK